MKLIKILLFIFISLAVSNKANSNYSLLDSLKDGEKLIFIRYAHAPGAIDLNNFNILDCSTQRNLSKESI